MRLEITKVTDVLRCMANGATRRNWSMAITDTRM